MGGGHDVTWPAGVRPLLAPAVGSPAGGGCPDPVRLLGGPDSGAKSRAVSPPPPRTSGDARLREVAVEPQRIPERSCGDLSVEQQSPPPPGRARLRSPGPPPTTPQLHRRGCGGGGASGRSRRGSRDQAQVRGGRNPQEVSEPAFGLKTPGGLQGIPSAGRRTWLEERLLSEVWGGGWRSSSWATSPNHLPLGSPPGAPRKVRQGCS